MLYNIRLLEDIEDVYRKGECIKAYIDEEDGRAYPWSGTGIEIYPEQYHIIMPGLVFDKLLEEGQSGD
jgi:hypothetical protein